MMRASGAKRVHRKTAKKVLDEFMVRVFQVNEDSRFAVRVTEVIVFGSYLEKKDTLGDLDIACKYESKFANLDPSAFSKKMQDHSSRSGRRFKSSMESLLWPWEEVRLFLKSRRRTISLHDVSEVMQLMEESSDFKCQVLLGDPKR
jgi:predicted nucleotidyltransferase